ncbi:hypothetical protein GH714_009623 [Hevea brasiliensis]|uniref:Uncharacterized protein n=1 Tax=Hevea brasiliensis TaxID=3981 RepID=A0A6A6KD03_HEVBR|nr:hypothetical protein GH714_009623 [Hevea brasiliensis]
MDTYPFPTPVLELEYDRDANFAGPGAIVSTSPRSFSSKDGTSTFLATVPASSNNKVLAVGFTIEVSPCVIVLGKGFEASPTLCRCFCLSHCRYRKLDRFSADSNALREDLRSFMNTFVKEKSKEFSTKDSGVGGAESGCLLSVPKDLPNPQMQDQSNIDNIATVEELLGAEYKTLGADEDVIDHQGKFQQKIEEEIDEFLEDDCGFFLKSKKQFTLILGLKIFINRILKKEIQN